MIIIIKNAFSKIYNITINRVHVKFRYKYISHQLIELYIIEKHARIGSRNEIE